MFARPGQDNRRPCYDCYFALFRESPLQLLGQFPNRWRLGFIRCDAAINELKYVSVRSRPLH